MFVRDAKTAGMPGASLLGASALFLCALVLPACAWLQGQSSDEELDELDKSLMVESRKTPFDKALRELNRMLKAYDLPPEPIQCKNIGNESADKGALPSDLYTMISSAMNKIGPEIIFIPYDAKYVMAEASTGGRLERRLPSAVITGGITGFDKDMIEKERKGDASGAWAGAQASARYGAGEGVSRISLDLSMLDYRTQSAIPGVMISNAIVIRKSKLGWAVSGSYMGCGGSFESDVKTKQGVHAALRYLVEFSVLELLGKYSEVPYWRCLPGANEDAAMCQRILDLVKAQSDERQAFLVKRKLYLHGVQGVNPDDPEISDSERSVIENAMRSRGCSTLAELYVALWKTVPIDEALALVAKDGKRRQAEMARRAEELAKRQAQEASERERVEQAAKGRYLQLVQQGDVLFSKGEYAKARPFYVEAANLLPRENYPKERLAAVDSVIAQAQARKAAAEKALSEGARLFAGRDYSGARAAYSEALRMDPGSYEAKGRLEEIDKLLRKKAPAGFGRIDENEFKEN